eukprot:1156864-Rhodomonas_salina.2
MLREGVRTIAKEKADEARLEAMLVLWKRQTSSNLKNSLAVTFGSDVNEHFDRRVRWPCAVGKLPHAVNARAVLTRPLFLFIPSALVALLSGARDV